VTCFSPLRGYRAADGSISFHTKVPQDSVSAVVACGQCSGCRRDRACNWATRCMHEASLYVLNSYVTLTYRDESIRSLRYEDFQLFMRYLRRARPRTKVRFFMCGEYGDQLGRPHFHALLFNCDFGDRKYFKSASGHKLYTSVELDSLWGHGFALVGGVSFQSAAYVARYVMKKVNGQLADDHYLDRLTGEMRVPEFCHMSLKPGIGALWLDRFGAEVYPEGQVLMNGVLRNAPKYYDRRFRSADPDAYDAMIAKRRDDALAGPALERGDARLAVKGVVSDARDRFFLKRTL